MSEKEPKPGRTGHGTVASRSRRMPLAGAILAGCGFLFAACANSAPSPVNPSSPRAEEINQLWWIFFAMAAAIFLLVLVVLVYGAIRTPGEAEQQRQHAFGTPLIWIGGITMPIIVLGIVFLLSTKVLVAFGGPLSPSRLTIEVTGHQWWWEVRYPQQGFITANEIHIPAGRQVEVRLTSDDVIHDFWVPELQGKMDAIPGETNSLTLETSKAGTYRGGCLVYCGLQHTNMNFIVVVDSPAQFSTWIAGQRATPSSPTDPAITKGQQVFLGSACVYCHAVSGTNASGRDGPNLTHFGSRQQIGAGVLPNNPGTLGGWIVNPQTIKPGNLMPPENFSGQELEDLITYLESLK